MGKSEEVRQSVLQYRDSIVIDLDENNRHIESDDITPRQKTKHVEGDNNKMSNEVIKTFEDEINKTQREKDKTAKQTGSNRNTLIIGVGAGGSSAASKGTQHKFKTIGVNTAKEDLDNLDLCSTFIIKNALGSGKERSRAKKLFIEDADRFLSFLNEVFNFDDINNIIVVYTAAGGTGSGIGPMMTNYLRDNIQGVNIFAAPLFGKINEDIKSQENMRDAIEETIAAEVNYLCFDNERATGNSFNEIFDKVNEEFISACRIISSEFLKPCRNNIDAADLQKLWLEKRRLHIISGKFDRKLTTGKNIEDQIIAAVSASVQLPIGNSPEWLNMGVFINVEDRFYGDIDETFRKLVDNYGEPYEMYKHLQVRDSADDAPDFAFIAAGLNHPNERYGIINTRISEFLSRRSKNDTIDSVERVSIERKKVDPDFVLQKSSGESKETNKSAFDKFKI